MKQKKWRIELTEHQLVLMAQCIEDCHRFMAGQMELDNSTRKLENPRVLWDRLKELQPFVTPEISIGASYDWAGTHCPNKDQKKFIAETYYLYRKIYEATFKERASTGASTLGTKYLSDTLTCADSGEPITVMVVGEDDIEVQKQNWNEFVRYFISCEHGIVIVDLHDNPVCAGCRAYLWNLWVDEPYRRKGIATRLLRKAEEIILDSGYDSLSLMWEWPTPQWVFDWYTKNGFEEKEFGGKCANMVKILR